MLYAERARDPFGVFTRINHDNNHHLISLWLQAVGVHASPLLARAPAIVAGTLAIPVAALLFARRSVVATVVSAALFAISPIFVTYGSEARGYAPMILAALLLIWLVTAAEEGRGTPATKWWIGACALLGMLSHLTMLAPVGLLTVWIYLAKRSTLGGARALPATLALMGPGVATCGAVLLMVLVAAKLSPTGMQVGGYMPFSFGDYGSALSNLMDWTVGVSFGVQWIAPIALLALGALLIARQPQWLGNRARLYGILILGVPLGILIERTGNALFARYYLCSAIGILLLAADWAGHSAAKRGMQAAVCGSAAVLFLLIGLRNDAQLVELRRGEPDRAVELVAQQSPHGARMAIGTARLLAPMVVAAERVDFPLEEARGCAPAEFMIAARDSLAKPIVMHCGRPMHAIAWSETTALTGDAWVLYRGGLPSRSPPVSGPRLAREAPFSGRAGVAQG
jgi:hypothetical protein